MKKSSKNIFIALMVSIMLAGISGCEKKKGPMEQVGEKIDNAVEKAGDSMKTTGEKIKDTTH